MNFLNEIQNTACDNVKCEGIKENCIKTPIQSIIWYNSFGIDENCHTCYAQYCLKSVDNEEQNSKPSFNVSSKQSSHQTHKDEILFTNSGHQKRKDKILPTILPNTMENPTKQTRKDEIFPNTMENPIPHERKDNRYPTYYPIEYLLNMEEEKIDEYLKTIKINNLYDYILYHEKNISFDKCDGLVEYQYSYNTKYPLIYNKYYLNKYPKYFNRTFFKKIIKYTQYKYTLNNVKYINNFISEQRKLSKDDSPNYNIILWIIENAKYNEWFKRKDPNNEYYNWWIKKLSYYTFEKLSYYKESNKYKKLVQLLSTYDYKVYIKFTTVNYSKMNNDNRVNKNSQIYNVGIKYNQTHKDLNEFIKTFNIHNITDWGPYDIADFLNGYLSVNP